MGEIYIPGFAKLDWVSKDHAPATRGLMEETQPLSSETTGPIKVWGDQPFLGFGGNFIQ